MEDIDVGRYFLLSWVSVVPAMIVYVVVVRRFARLAARPWIHLACALVTGIALTTALIASGGRLGPSMFTGVIAALVLFVTF